MRSTREARGLTQAELAAMMRVGRDWVVRLEQGHPRLEAQRVLDAVVVLGLVLTVEDKPDGDDPTDPGDPFAYLFENDRDAERIAHQDDNAGSGFGNASGHG